MTNPIEHFLDLLDQRLTGGAQHYGDRSFARAVSETVTEIDQELLDQVGWLYVLWCQAARKTDHTRRQDALRATFLTNLRHRLTRNNRGKKHEAFAAGPHSCMDEIEILAMDCFDFRQLVLRRLVPIARAIEVAQVMQPHDPYRGRRGSTRDPRSDD